MDFFVTMKCLWCPRLKGLYFLQTFDILCVIGMQLPSCAAVSPNSPEKIVPVPCPGSRYVFRDDNGDSKCRRCSVCPRGFQVQTECTAYNDTLCEQCPSGWYNDVSGSKCKPCAGCKPGEYIRRDCSVKRNTACRQCPRDMISVNANASRCVLCKTCRRNEKILFKCNASLDTLCGECNKDYFRESSTGNCLPCSHCPSVLQHRVVPECRDERGIHHPDICWPGDTQLRFPNFNKFSQSIDDVTQRSVKGISQETIPFIFFVATFGTLLCCTVVIVSAFTCIRLFPARSHYTNRSPQIDSIQMASLYINTDESLNDSVDSLPIGPEYTQLPPVGGTCDIESLEDAIPLKWLESNKCYNDRRDCCEMSPNTRSAPDIYTSCSMPISKSFKGKPKTKWQMVENWQLLRSESWFPDEKTHGTL